MSTSFPPPATYASSPLWRGIDEAGDKKNKQKPRENDSKMKNTEEAEMMGGDGEGGFEWGVMWVEQNKRTPSGDKL